uniref:Uncharacterized protein n=1 Tax=Rhodosorus marinus TaxID=101924 RepID=A0A7S3EB90_9RHOD|mmetsp:Transcript_22275/g.89854  ORF Transcript_22275/g.89854 Transcript_22275/m.89854 type:complete len:218 (+) Transcript_22275:319-972(+)|eukprot:CAMPEP_0113955408 /NCGR_PEP_ID=MMETSP0011_2-20120614/1310_1 /TAXON_ID=101924 /ORGANISM="Rhodosorus marinus" /LENGTH=217 /DNA_ID=CAMNT_0000965081 /DNA_START=195 /DNA_END=848 /DNA_ORIENTATION=+ /assembly_acc=CAM_ASM_000156
MLALIGMGVSAVAVGGVLAYELLGGFQRPEVKEIEMPLGGKTAMMKLTIGYGGVLGGIVGAFNAAPSGNVRKLAILYDNPADLKEIKSTPDHGRFLSGVILDDFPEDERSEAEKKLAAAGYKKYPLFSGKAYAADYKIRRWPFLSASLACSLPTVFSRVENCTEKRKNHKVRMIIEFFAENVNGCMCSVTDTNALENYLYEDVRANEPKPGAAKKYQ